MHFPLVKASPSRTGLLLLWPVLLTGAHFLHFQIFLNPSKLFQIIVSDDCSIVPCFSYAKLRAFAAFSPNCARARAKALSLEIRFRLVNRAVLLIIRF